MVTYIKVKTKGGKVIEIMEQEFNDDLYTKVEKSTPITKEEKFTPKTKSKVKPISSENIKEAE